MDYVVRTMELSSKSVCYGSLGGNLELLSGRRWNQNRNGLVFVARDGQTVMAQFHLPDDQFVNVRFAGRELRLPHVISGSGARYSDDKTTFWNRGKSVLVEVDDKIVVQDCMLQGGAR